MKTLKFLFIIGCSITLLVIIDHAAAARSTKRAKRDPCGQNELNQMDKLISNILPFNNPKVLPPETIEGIPQFCL